MKFTLVFPSHESPDLSIGAVFIPCLVWVLGQKILFNPHRDNPNYLSGDFQNLLCKLFLSKLAPFDFNQHKGKKIWVVVHSNGHGDEQYLSDLLIDIIDAGFKPVVCR